LDQSDNDQFISTIERGKQLTGNFLLSLQQLVIKYHGHQEANLQ